MKRREWGSVGKRSCGSQSGQALSEYGLVIAIVVLGLVAVLGTFRNELASAFASLGASVRTQIGGSGGGN